MGDLMKLNNKGFAISTIMYMILIMAIVLITLTLSLLSNRKFILDKAKEEAKDNIYSICKAVTNKTVTTGNVPKGKYEPGDEYICEVGPGKKYTFFILSKEENTINLIMDSNIASDGTAIKLEKTIDDLLANGKEYDTAWISTEDYSGNLCDPNDESIKILSGKTNKYEIGVWCSQNYAKADKGPVTAFKYLQSATTSWTYLPDIQINYEDEGNIYGTINTDGTKTTITQKDGTVTATFNNLKARLPKYEEINNLFMDKTYSLDNFEENGLTKLPEWVTMYIHNHYLYPCYGCSDEKVWRLGGYWLLSSSPLEDFDYAAYDISTQGSYGYSNCLATRKFFDTSTGIRPVISIPLNRIN